MLKYGPTPYLPYTGRNHIIKHNKNGLKDLKAFIQLSDTFYTVY